MYRKWPRGDTVGSSIMEKKKTLEAQGNLLGSRESIGEWTTYDGILAYLDNAVFGPLR